MDVTYDEIRLAVEYNISDKDEFISQLTSAFSETEDKEMKEVMTGLIDKVRNMTDAEYKILLNIGDAII